MEKIRLAANKYASTRPGEGMAYLGFKNGAMSSEAKEYHQRSMYSEEELIEIAMEYQSYVQSGEECSWDFRAWFNENRRK